MLVGVSITNAIGPTMGFEALKYISYLTQNWRKEVNVMLKKEAEYFGDIVSFPSIDR